MTGKSQLVFPLLPVSYLSRSNIPAEIGKDALATGGYFHGGETNGRLRSLNADMALLESIGGVFEHQCRGGGSFLSKSNDTARHNRKGCGKLKCQLGTKVMTGSILRLTREDISMRLARVNEMLLEIAEEQKTRKKESQERNSESRILKRQSK
jgi:hypothetical protein